MGESVLKIFEIVGRDIFPYLEIDSLFGIKNIPFLCSILKKSTYPGVTYSLEQFWINMAMAEEQWRYEIEYEEFLQWEYDNADLSHSESYW
tara:strand:+ start:2147 stop:2419 length:273 start_codon:yes stop_codon:yes gene_type:complete